MAHQQAIDKPDQVITVPEPDDLLSALLNRPIAERPGTITIQTPEATITVTPRRRTLADAVAEPAPAPLLCHCNGLRTCPCPRECACWGGSVGRLGTDPADGLFER